MIPNKSAFQGALGQSGFFHSHPSADAEVEEISIRLPKSVVSALTQLAESHGDTMVELLIKLYNEHEHFEQNQQRLEVLEEALDGAINFIYENDLHLEKPSHPRVQDELNVLKEAFDGVITFLLEKENQMRQTIVDVMNLSLKYWEECNEKDKIQLVEESGLWKAYLDRGTYQTRTFDKYLSLHTLPNRPNFKKVLKTGKFVLAQCNIKHSLREQLEKSHHDLAIMIRSEK